MYYSSSSLLILVFVIKIQYAECDCPQSFKSIGSGCYFFRHFPVASHDFALRACMQLGGYLVNINTESEQRHLVDEIIASKFSSNIQGYWIGAVFNGQKWVWQKSNQGALVFVNFNPNYANWALGQPLYNRISRFGAIGAWRPFKWYSVPQISASTMGYICETDWQPHKWPAFIINKAI